MNDDKTTPAEREKAPIPWWVPSWMSELERSAFIIAVGMVVAAILFSIGLHIALHDGPIDIR